MHRTKHTHCRIDRVLLRWLPGRRFLLQRLSSNLLFRTFAQTHFPFITIYISCWATKVLSDVVYFPSTLFFLVILHLFFMLFPQIPSLNLPVTFLLAKCFREHKGKVFSNLQNHVSFTGDGGKVHLQPGTLDGIHGSIRTTDMSTWHADKIISKSTGTEPRENIWKRTLRKILAALSNLLSSSSG